MVQRTSGLRADGQWRELCNGARLELFLMIIMFWNYDLSGIRSGSPRMDLGNFKLNTIVIFHGD
jgi:hypothetical protein